MKPRRPKQLTPKELTDTLLDFLARKFYPDDVTSYMKDRSRLLAWVVLWPASWLNKKGVSLPADKYRELFFQVFFEAKACGTEKIKYRPAWLRMVIQSHFLHHGDEIYERAKSIRSLVEHIVLSTGKRPDSAEAHPTDDMARARQIIAQAKPVKRKKQPNNDQLTML
jgi:hypothetical protein